MLVSGWALVRTAAEGSQNHAGSVVIRIKVHGDLEVTYLLYRSQESSDSARTQAMFASDM